MSQCHINLPFIDVVQQMPKYSMFLLNFLCNKKNLEQVTKGNAQENDTLINSILPKKKPNPKRLFHPRLTSNLPLMYSLVDVGADVNLIPHKIFKQLDIKNLN